MIDVSAVIVSWNTADLLDLCLQSLIDHPPTGRSMEIVVVDNGSTDGSDELVRSKYPQVVLEANAKNEGYTRANNRAMRQSKGKYLLLINADAFVTAGSIDTMLARLEQDPRAAVVGPRLVYGDGSWQRWTAGRKPDLTSVLSFFLYLERLSRAAARNSLFLARDTREAFCPDWVCSAAMIVRRDALDEVGLMDERYFCYMDDTDICQRFRDAGWTVWYEPAAEVVHFGSASSKRQFGRVPPAAIRNFNDYLTRHNGVLAGETARLAQCVGYVIRAAASAVRTVLKTRDDRFKPTADHFRNARMTFKRGHV